MEPLRDERVVLEPASEANVDRLVRWTLDPVAQGPYKRVPRAAPAELRALFLHEPTRQYFLVRAAADGRPLGRLYWRGWRFGPEPDPIDWELNILLADPSLRGRGFGSAAQLLACRHLLTLPETASVFAYTRADNAAERRALEKAGLEPAGPLPHPHYRLPVPEGEFVLYVARKRSS